ncbi:MAG: 3-hydroxyacyl-CoA dehydrogenase family protein [Peptostreptococcaceae bacterium]|nr:3-hydroxyacyl-CoA dehydrogenase family protein [Peptostreptococcaceae bacterium]
MKKASDVKNITIAGAGTMGASMGETFAKFGYKVTIYDLFPEALLKAKKLIQLNHETEIKEGIISEEKAKDILNNLSFTSEKDSFKTTDFVVEAILEKIEVKHDFWKEVSNIVPDDAILASNTSGLSITKIAEVINKPERFGGMHWINPPHIIPLIEIIKGEKTADETAEFLKDMTLAVKKEPAVVNDALGFVLNRIQLAILRESLHIIEEGIADKEAVDAVMKYGLGPRYACLGPFEVCDLGGLDIFYNIATYLFEDLADNKEPFGILKECAERGNYGVKTEKGFYDYSDGKAEEAIKYRDMMYTKVSKCLFGDK